jgi:integration host factor subunit beta
MIKSELILRIAGQNPHLREKDVEDVVNTILSRITDALVAGDRVELRGFGAFTVKLREARMGVNPRNGAVVLLADARVLAFKPGKAMKARLINTEVYRPSVPEPDTQWQSRWLGRGPTAR